VHVVSFRGLELAGDDNLSDMLPVDPDIPVEDHLNRPEIAYTEYGIVGKRGGVVTFAEWRCAADAKRFISGFTVVDEGGW